VASIEALFSLVEPHPALVAATTPTPAQVVEAIGVFGLLTDPDARWFRPAVTAERV
jgi:hypothetical protein